MSSINPALAPENRSGDATSNEVPVVKTTVNLPPDAIEALRELANARRTSVADIIRRAIWMEKYLHDATKEGGKILIEEKDKTIKQLVLR
jgi:hypothetical protein